MKKNAALLWSIVGWVVFVALPWYRADGGSIFSFSWLGAITDSKLAPALFQLLLHDRLLFTPFPVLLVALSTTGFLGMEQKTKAKFRLTIGALGLIWMAMEGFAINHHGWAFPWLKMLFPPVDPQAGFGLGAAMIGIVFLGAISGGFAGLGFCRGDSFIVTLLLSIIALIGLFVFFPVLLILKSAFSDNDGSLAPDLLVEKLFDQSIWRLACLTGEGSCGVAWNTLYLGLVVALGATLLGLAMALLIVRTQLRFKPAMNALTLLPVITPPFVIGLAMILLFGRAGWISGLLDDWFGLAPSRWIYGAIGVGVAQLLAFTPIAFLVLLGVVQGVSPALEEAAQTLRASRWTVFRTVTWPLLRPGVANAFLLSFVESMADFGNPLVLGGNFEVLSTKIFFSVVGASHDQGKAAVLAIVLLSFTLTVFYIQHRWLGRASYTTVTGKGDSGIAMPLPQALRRICTGLAYSWILFTLVIYATIFLGGFVKSVGRDFSPTLEYYITAFAIEQGSFGLVFSGSAWDSLFTTLEVSAISAPLTALIGILTAYLLTRQRFNGQRSFEFGTMLSFAIPGTVIGVSYILAFNVPPIELTGTGLILIICFVFRNMPVGIRAGIATLSQIDKSLDEASLMLRAGSATTLRRVIAPLMRPAVITALIYSFVRSMTAVSAVIFLVSAKYNLATAYIVSRVEAVEYGLAIAYSSALIVVMLVVILGIRWAVGERQLGRRPQPVIALGT